MTFFVIQASRGTIRDRKTRRKSMLVMLVLALLFLFSGSTFLQSALDPRGHPGRFILFWAICAWLTMAAILLAVFDLLIVKLEGRQNERTLREKFALAKSGLAKIHNQRIIVGVSAQRSGYRSREEMEAAERFTLAPFAQKSGDSRGRKYSESPHAYRTEFHAIVRGSFIRARFAGSSIRRRFFSTGRAIICAHA